jgi:hypothetical protein
MGLHRLGNALPDDALEASYHVTKAEGGGDWLGHESGTDNIKLLDILPPVK